MPKTSACWLLDIIMTDQEWDVYCDKLSKAYDGKKTSEIENADKYHDAAVNMIMLRKSKRILMFCRRMSVFSKSFYKDKNLENLDSREEVVKESLKKFFENDEAHMVVIVTEKPKINDFLLGEQKLRELVDDDKLWIYKIPKDFGSDIPHFTIADDVEVRIETDDENKVGTCFFHNDSMVADLKDSFDTFKAYSALISC